MSYTFERDLSQLAESGTAPLLALAEMGNLTPEETFELLSREFAEAYDKGELTVSEKGISFTSSLATIILTENQNEESPYSYYLRFNLAPVTETELLTRERAQEIHRLLLDHFEAGEWHPMVVVSQVLNKAGFRKERFGFSKMKGMFLALATFLTMRDTITNGTPDVEIRIRPLDESAPAVQTTTDYSFSNDLSQLIQADSPAVAAYARNCNKSVENAFEELCDVFESAYARGAIREDALGLHFADGNVAVSLVPNSVTESPYPYYLSFREEIQTNIACEVLDLEDEQDIYRLLTVKFPVGEWLPMASVSLVMVQAGFPKERFGFTKMRDMLETLRRFISLQPTVTNGVPAILVKIHRVSEWEQGPAATPIQTDKNAVTLPATLREAKLTAKTLSKINLYMTGIEAYPPESVIDSLCAAYDEAEKPSRTFKVGETFRFATDLKTANGKDIAATIKASEMEGVDWYLNWGGPAETSVSCKPGEMLERFAYLGPWQEFLSTLAEKALPEKWSFKDAAEGDYTILRQYIKFTFYHLHLEDKVLTTPDKTLAAFNTGLVNRHYEDIYACFVPNPKKTPEWLFKGFCIAGERGLGKQLVDSFEPLPEAASYFTVKDDLLLDIDREIYADYWHIIIDNMDRLPLDFLQDELRVSEEATTLLEELTKAAPYQKSALYDQLRDLVGASSRLYNRLKNRVSDAIDFAVKRVRWNFKTALPCFYPQGNAMSLMLPLALMEDDRVDVALVVERTRSGSYQGQTIMTLQAAYIDARLICRPDSEWLSTSDINSFDAEEE